MPNEQLSSGKGQAGAQPPVYWMHILGITLLLTQSRLVLPAHSESTTAWLMSTALCFVGGAVAAGLWNVVRRPTIAQSGRHFVAVSWVLAGLVVVGSFT